MGTEPECHLRSGTSQVLAKPLVRTIATAGDLRDDGIHRAAMRGESTHYQRRADEAAQELAQGASIAEPGKERLLATRRAFRQSRRSRRRSVSSAGVHEQPNL